MAKLGALALLLLIAIAAKCKIAQAAIQSAGAPVVQSSVLDDNAKGVAAKTRAIAVLKNYGKSNQDRIDSLETALKKMLGDSQNIKFGKGEQRDLQVQYKALEEGLSRMSEKRAEYLARRKFYDQLIFQLDTKWSTQPLRVFLSQVLLDMAVSELMDSSHDAGGSGKVDVSLTKFYANLSIAIREIPESREDLLDFVEGYINYSSILNPKSPLSFQQDRNYTGGSVNVVAQPMKIEDAAKYVDEHLTQKKLTHAKIQPGEPLASPDANVKNENGPDIELRFKARPATTTAPQAN